MIHSQSNDQGDKKFTSSYQSFSIAHPPSKMNAIQTDVHYNNQFSRLQTKQNKNLMHNYMRDNIATCRYYSEKIWSVKIE
jgi:hypothetical protein